MGQLETILEKKLPSFLSKKLTGGAEGLLKRILDLNIRITKRYTNSRYFDEIKGISEGAAGKIKEKDILRLNLFPELIKAACTVAGVWKEATDNGQTLHVRALDWDYKNPISKYPVVIIYHPSDPKLHVHANFAWAGFIGSLTGISDKVSLGEKVWIPPKGSVKTTRYGNPWTYVFRDILYEANDLKSAIQIMTKTHRTCAIHIGLASSTDHSFRMFEYSETSLTNYDDSNYTHYGANHPKKSGLAYFDKHVQPSGDTCVGQVLTSNLYGHWNGENLYRHLGLTHQTGDTQLAVFDLENLLAYVSYSSSDGTVKAF
jgi:hypothetical protein